MTPSAQRILVAGGAGFLGSHLCEKLAGRGYDVVAYDDLSTGNRRNIDAARMVHPNRIELYVGDVRKLRRSMFNQGREFNAVFNLACPASPVKYQLDPVLTFETSVFGTSACLKLAACCNASFLQASTSEVYGDPLIHPQPETYWGNVNPIGVRSSYDEGKRGAETLTADYRRCKSVKSTIVRIFNTYGPRLSQGDGRVVSNFVVRALTGRPLIVYGDGSQTRSFCYVDDTIDGVIVAWESGELGPFNVGATIETTVADLAMVVINELGSRSDIVNGPLPDDDPIRRRPDASKMAALGWSPRVSLVDGIKRTAEYFERELSAGRITL